MRKKNNKYDNYVLAFGIIFVLSIAAYCGYREYTCNGVLVRGLFGLECINAIKAN